MTDFRIFCLTERLASDRAILYNTAYYKKIQDNIMNTISFRTEEETKKKLDQLAAAQKRDRSFIINEAINYYLSLQDWQIAHIEEGVKQAKKKQFATDKEMRDILEKWMR